MAKFVISTGGPPTEVGGPKWRDRIVFASRMRSLDRACPELAEGLGMTLEALAWDTGSLGFNYMEQFQPDIHEPGLPPHIEPEPPPCQSRLYLTIFIILSLLIIAGLVGYIIWTGNQEASTGPEIIYPHEQSPTADWQVYKNEKLGYSIKYPKDWTFREFPDTKTGAGFRPLDKPAEIQYEFINIDARGTALSHYDVPFDEYVKGAAVLEIQNYEKLNSIESLVTDSGEKGYTTTWIYKTLGGEERISSPITYFDNKKIIQAQYGPYKTVQITSNNKEYQEIYEEMIRTFVLKDETANWQVYRNEELGYEIKYPKEFTLNTSFPEQSIIGKQLGDSKEFTQFLIYHTSDFPLELRGYALISETVTQVDSLSARKREFLSEDGLARLVFVQLVKDDVYYSFKMQNTTGEESEMRTLNQILSTFKFIK